MRYAAAVAASAALLAVAGPASAAPGDCTPRVSPPETGLTVVSEQQVDARTTVYTFRSKAVGSQVTPQGLVRARVILPSGYGEDPSLHYPVLYFLHGAGSNATRIPQETLKGILGDAQVILVSPDGGSSGYYSDWYGSSDSGPKPPPAWETFHTEELLPWVDANLRTTGKRAIAGESMGGFGAMSYAARNEGLFVAAGSFSGAVDIQAGEVVVPAALSVLYNPCIWGHPVWQRDNWSAHNPTALAPRLRGVSLFVASGNGLPGRHDETPPRPPESMAFEAVIYRMSQNFVEALERAEVPVTTWFYGNGTHGWQDPYSNQRYIYDDLAQFLPQAMAALGPAEPGE